MNLRFDKDTVQLGTLELNTGDVILTGRFKNKKATIKGFAVDENNQPVVKTNKGTVKLLTFRIPELME